MKALQLVGTQKLKFVDIPIPEISEDEVLIKIKKVGICGTDLHLYNGGMKVPLPIIMGHEFVGDIAKVGANVSNIKIGDKVVAEHVIGCGKCRYCQYGKKNLCVKPTVIGLQIQGGLAEYLAVPANLVYVLPSNLDYDDGVLVEPISIAVYGIRKANVGVGDSVAIIGQGPIGLFLDQIAKAAGATVFGIDIMQPRLDYALDHHLTDFVINSKTENVLASYHKHTGTEGADIVFEVVGVEPTIDLAFGLVRPQGKIVVLGVFEHDVSVNMMEIVKHEVTVMGSWTCVNSFGPTINLLESKRIKINGLITHRYPFDHAQDAFKDSLNYSDKRIKSVIEF
ncbi:MAG: alcohol dehydrogenase catalytic domain-containing protein [Patescibacteria group bacterium]|jgi:2-desacetyl-2-hydroxyethyl bacteriochlorophyllide A dehydrogenase